MGRHENGAFPLFALPQPDLMHRKDQMGHVNAGRCPHAKGEPPPSPHIAWTRRADVVKVHRCLFFIFLLIAPVQVTATRMGPHSSRMMKTTWQSFARRRGCGHPAYGWRWGRGHTAPPMR